MCAGVYSATKNLINYNQTHYIPGYQSSALSNA